MLLVPVAAVLVLVLAVAAVLAAGPQRVRDLVIEPASPTPTVPRPTPTTAAAALGTPTPRPSAAPDSAAVQRRLAQPVSAEALGKRFGGRVVDPATGKTLFDRRGTVGATPASTTKLVTSVAALRALGPAARFRTSVVSDGGSVVLVGGGDPTLLGPKNDQKPSSYPKYASLTDLAERTARALEDSGSTRPVTVRIDDSLYSGPSTGPGWKPNYVGEGSVAPVSALAIDHGWKNPRTTEERVADPARHAGRAFASALEQHGVPTTGTVKRVTAAADATELAEVASPTVADLVEETLEHSDNDLAEALARHVALDQGKPASFAGAATAVQAVLERLGVARGIDVYDGSGLSTKNRITPEGLTDVLTLAASGRYPKLGPVLSGLPVGGFSGTLTDRFAASGTEPGVGAVRAKTGTLSGVSSLAGYVKDADGRMLVFAFFANGVPDRLAWQSQVALDRLAATLATCGCT